ncbi:MAG TPA: fumarate hydratase [Clostridiales bacterium]|jgi:fumarate hydratase subunit alpha|nr:fumarate hydratase [Clostridiales bacterium]
MDDRIIKIVSNGLVTSGSSFLPDKKAAYERAISKETNPQAKWVLEKILENAIVAEKNQSPLCDDTGVPHLMLDIGPNCPISGDLLESIKEGISQGLRKLPGRPMSIKGDDAQRLDQSLGMEVDPGALEAAPILIRTIKENKIKLHIIMFGGGSAIRAKTYRVFHKHNVDNVIDEIISWATEGTKLLGCTPCTIAVGIGRSHYEATSMMFQALVDGTYDMQSNLEKRITDKMNASGVGSLGLGGNTTVLATFMKVGPQRASGVRIVSMRPCCCFEPRIATIEL